MTAGFRPSIRGIFHCSSRSHVDMIWIMSARQIVHTLKKDGPAKEVRHLLLNLENGPGAATLSQLINAIETPIAAGTQYEMGQKADEVAEVWRANEEFKYTSDNSPAFDSLKNTIALAALMGHTFVYDARYKSQRDLIGEVPLSQWPGMTPKNGGGYLYAFDGMKIIAEPTLPPNHGISMEFKTPQQTLTVMKKIAELRDTVGPRVEFLLGGDQSL